MSTDVSCMMYVRSGHKYFIPDMEEQNTLGLIIKYFTLSSSEIENMF